MSAPPRPVRVEAWAGGRGEEEPRRILLDGSWLEVRQVLERWREPSGRWFRVLAADGGRPLLECREGDLDWWLHPNG